MPLKDLSNQSQDSLVKSIRSLLQTGSAMYMFITEKTIAKFGFEGERAIRRHLRAYGKWRGREMRLAHQALGLPINMETLMKNWDSASTLYGEIEKGGTFTPSKVLHEVKACPASEMWKSHQFWRWGHMFCDEFHQACVSSYHPDGYVVIPENLMKGDSACKFSWIMAPQTQEIEFGPVTELGKRLADNYGATSPHEAAVQALKRTVRILAGRYLTLARELVTAFGDQGEEVLCNGLQSWAHKRGGILHEQHESLSLQQSAATIFNNFDVPYQFLWDASETNNKSIYRLEVFRCPLSETWRELDGLDLGYVYCRETYRPILESYGIKGNFALKNCICEGDEKCLLEISSFE
jgi:hypothetical protein